MSIVAKQNKSKYELFLEKEINEGRKIRIYETDSEEELFEKWKQEPLTLKKQQLVWDFFPNTE